MADLIPDEERAERVREYLAKRREVTPVIDGERFDTIHDIDLGSAGHVRLLASDLEVLVQLVSPVTREDAQELITEAQAHLSKSGQTPTGGLFQRMLTALESLSVSPPAEVEWEYAWRYQDPRSGEIFFVEKNPIRSGYNADPFSFLDWGWGEKAQLAAASVVKVRRVKAGDWGPDPLEKGETHA